MISLLKRKSEFSPSNDNLGATRYRCPVFSCGSLRNNRWSSRNKAGRFFRCYACNFVTTDFSLRLGSVTAL